MKATLLLAGFAVFAQMPAKSNPTPLPVYEIRLSEATGYPSISWWKDDRIVQTQCNGDGNVFVWKGMMGLVALTPDGIKTFFSDKLTDIPHASLAQLGADLAISDSGVFYRASGFTDDDIKKTTETVKDEKGYSRPVQRREAHFTSHHIARFDKDGHYQGAINDLPFTIFRLAVFNSGTFVAQGMDKDRRLRVALLDSRGQFLRELELPKDISAVHESLSNGPIKPCEECQPNSVESMLISGHFTPARGRILFYRAGMNSTRAYEIQDSGAINVVDFKLPKGYSMEGLLPSDTTWLVKVRNLAVKDTRSLLEIDPETGDVLREYRYTDPATDLSCYANREFWGLRRSPKEERLKVVRGTAETD